MKKCSQNSLFRYFDVVEKNEGLLGERNKQQNQFKNTTEFPVEIETRAKITKSKSHNHTGESHSRLATDSLCIEIKSNLTFYCSSVRYCITAASVV